MKYPEEFQFVKSNKGHDKLVYENYVYTLQTKRDTYRSWRCEKRRQCKARIDYDGKNAKIKKGLWDHTHEADPSRIEILKVKEEMKVLALLDREADADTIFRKVTENSSPEVVKKLSAEVCKRNINRFKTTCTLPNKMLSSADSTTDSVEKTPFISTSLDNSQSGGQGLGAAEMDDNQVVQIKVEPDTEDVDFINEELPSFLKSQKGKKKLTWKGYVYNLDKKKPGKHFWKCEKRRLCSGRVICSEGEVELSKMHTHPPDITRIKKLKIREKIRAEALSTDDSKNSAKILENVMKEVSSDISNLLSADKMRNTIRYVRKKRMQNPSTADITNCAEEKEQSDDEMQFRLPKVPQVPKGPAKKSKGDLSQRRQGRSKNIADKENRQNIQDDEENVEIIEKDNEITEDTENEDRSVSESDDLLPEKLRKRLRDDFTPKLKDLRETIILQVEQMMLDFEENFFSYLLSITEDSSTVLTGRYRTPDNTIVSDNEEDDDSEEDGSDGSDEEEEDTNEEEEKDEDSEYKNEDSENEDEEDDDDENYGRRNRSAKSQGKKSQSNSKKNSINTKKVTFPLKMTLRKPPINESLDSLDSSISRKRKPPYDYDSTDEVNLPQRQTPPSKTKRTPPPKSKRSNSVGVTEIDSPKKKRKISSVTRKGVLQKSGESSMLSSINSNDGDSLTTATKELYLLSPILLPDGIKVENISLPSGNASHSHMLQDNLTDSNILELSSIVEGSSSSSCVLNSRGKINF